MGYWFKIGSLFESKKKGCLMGSFDFPEKAKLEIYGGMQVAISERDNYSGKGPIADLYLVPPQDREENHGR